MQSTTVVQGTTVGVAQPPANRGQNMRLQAGATLGLGITQIVLGGVCILASIIALAAGCDRDEARDHACGIWSGIFFAITGVIGIVAARTKANGSITAFMIMCIISSVLCLVTLSYGSASVAQARDEYGVYDSYYGYYYIGRCHGKAQDTSIAMGVILIIAALAEAVVAITASGIACGAVCCGNRSPAGVVYVPSQGTATTYVIQSGNAPVAQPYPAGGYAQPATVPYNGPPGQYPMQQAPPQQYPPQQYPQAGGMMPPPYNEPTAQAVDHKQPSYNPEHPAQ